MNRIFSLTIVLAVLSGCIKDKQTGADLKVGDVIPDFEVLMNDGSRMTDDVLKEQGSVVVFFHTSCPDCQQVLPEVQKIYDEYISKGIITILISREESQEYIYSFWEQKGLKMPFSAQTDRKIYEKFASNGIPRIYINEKGGIIKYIFTDNPNPSYEDIKSAVEEIIR